MNQFLQMFTQDWRTLFQKNQWLDTVRCKGARQRALAPPPKQLRCERNEMLYLLTGEIQTGKTRWLQKLIAELETRGVCPYGVIAPGRWIEHQTDNGPEYEKTGIDNELLPQHEIVPFARRAEDMSSAEAKATCSQAQNAQLAWAIDDRALDRVNEHLAWVARVTDDSASSVDLDWKGLLVIDELGRLELLRGGGLTSALSLVDRGSTTQVPHALVIVRAQLLDQALERFAKAPWGGVKPIHPTPQAFDELTALG